MSTGLDLEGETAPAPSVHLAKAQVQPLCPRPPFPPPGPPGPSLTRLHDPLMRTRVETWAPAHLSASNCL